MCHLFQIGTLDLGKIVSEAVSVRGARAMPQFAGIDALEGKRIGAEKVSMAGMLVLGEGNGRFRDDVCIVPAAVEALQQLKADELDAVLANRFEIEAVFKGDAAFPVEQVAFERLPQAGLYLPCERPWRGMGFACYSCARASARAFPSLKGRQPRLCGLRIGQHRLCDRHGQPAHLGEKSRPERTRMASPSIRAASKCMYRTAPTAP